MVHTARELADDPGGMIDAGSPRVYGVNVRG
jgi:hypothetical protein